MEMPSGWERLNEKIHLKDSFSDSTSCSRYEVRLALDLMKEMAEMLEIDYREWCLSHDPENCGVNTCIRRREILKRFREWK